MVTHPLLNVPNELGTRVKEKVSESFTQTTHLINHAATRLELSF